MNGYIENPGPVNGSLVDRLAEMVAYREELCLYNETLQNAKVVHLKGEESSGHRLLVHFYAFLFAEDWRQDLWMKRFVRDHLRYIDEIQCSAARAIQAIRSKARSLGSEDGSYDAFHIRRGDFQYQNMHMSAEEVYENNTKGIVKEGRTVYILTDEKNSSYFEPLRKHYNLLFLGDIKAELGDLNPNFYGQVDQLIASRAEKFFGAYYSTFTGYIMRLRGYHAQKGRLPGYEQGASDSYYYTPESLSHKRTIMQRYTPVRPALWEREFPIGWRDIDFDVQGQIETNKMQSSS